MSETIEIPKKLLIDLVDLWNRKHQVLNGYSSSNHKPYGSPNHSHLIPGVWDSDNGELANKPCAECALHDEVRRIIGDV